MRSFPDDPCGGTSELAAGQELRAVVRIRAGTVAETCEVSFA